MLRFLASLFRKGEPPRQDQAEDDAELRALRDELSWMFPPDTLVDGALWDKYWKDQVEHDVVGYTDMFCRDGDLIDAMRTAGAKRVLCVGAGLSLEPQALAAAGFNVDVLDLSAWVIDRLTNVRFPSELLDPILEGRTQAQGGSLECFAGDLMDASLCVGPYDVIMERRTLQLYSDGQRDMALDVVANRLAPTGLFFSHCHDGGWRPPAPRRHRNESWFDRQGWKRWNGTMPSSGRVAWLLVTTG